MDRLNQFRIKLRRFGASYSAFMEKQGFYIVLGACVLVIIGTAIWTHTSNLPATPPPQGQAADADYDSVQSLEDAESLHNSPLPSPTPVVAPDGPLLDRPLKNASLPSSAFASALANDSPLLPFDGVRPVFFQDGNFWQLHTGVDYGGTLGEPVLAVADGTCTYAAQFETMGLTVTITHQGGLESRYCGLASTPLMVGDPVTVGQTIGAVGTGPLWEQSQGPHLHFELWKNGQPMDPEENF